MKAKAAALRTTSNLTPLSEPIISTLRPMRVTKGPEISSLRAKAAETVRFYFCLAMILSTVSQKRVGTQKMFLE